MLSQGVGGICEGITMRLYAHVSKHRCVRAPCGCVYVAAALEGMQTLSLPLGKPGDLCLSTCYEAAVTRAGPRPLGRLTHLHVL